MGSEVAFSTLEEDENSWYRRTNQKYGTTYWKHWKAQLKFELSENIENIREVNFGFSEYFIPDEYKIKGQTLSYKQNLNEIEYLWKKAGLTSRFCSLYHIKTRSLRYAH